MNFERGKDPKESIGIGKEAILRDIGEIIIKEAVRVDEYSKYLSRDIAVNVIIMHRKDGKYEVVKNTIALSENHFGEEKIPPIEEKDLFSLLNMLLEAFKKYGINPIFHFPRVKKVVAKLISTDLVEVKPMSAPLSTRWAISGISTPPSASSDT